MPLVASGTDLGKIPEGWEVKPFSEVVYMNPTTKIDPNKTYRHVAMDNLSNGVVLEISDRSDKRSGTKFRHRDVLLARITPCLQNGK